MPLIEELCKAYEATGGTDIVILSQVLSKTDMEQKIMDMEIDMLGSRVHVRNGHPFSQDDLQHVSCSAASSIIVMPDRNKPLFMKVGGSVTDVVMLDFFMGKLMVQ